MGLIGQGLNEIRRRDLGFMVAIMVAIGIIRVPDEAGPHRLSAPLRLRMLFNNQMKTDVWALVGIVVTTIQVQQVTH